MELQIIRGVKVSGCILFLYFTLFNLMLSTYNVEYTIARLNLNINNIELISFVQKDQV